MWVCTGSTTAPACSRASAATTRPKGPAVFRLTDHMQRLHNSARLIDMELPYSVDELRDATNDLLGANGLDRVLHPPDRLLRLRPARRLGARQPGRDGDHVVAVGHLPRRGGARVGHPRRRSRAGSASRRTSSRTPSKATGVYLNSMLAVNEAQRAGLRRGDPAHARRERRRRPRRDDLRRLEGQDLHARPLDRDPARDHARLDHPDRDTTSVTRCVEKNLIRSDLYLADEVFMCGTAAEVTPLRSVDDHEIGVGPGHARAAEGVSRHGAGRERPLGAVARARAEHDARVSTRRADARADRALGALDRRARRGARARGAALGPALARARAGRASSRCSPMPSARRTAPRSRRGRRACTSACTLAGVGPGDEVITSPYSFVASANCAIYEGATRSSPTSTRTRSTSTRRPSRPRSRRGRRPSSPSTSSATRASSTSCARSATGTGSRSSRTRARRSAPGTRGSRSARTAISRPGPSTRTSRSRPARAARSRPRSAEEHELLVSLRNQGRLETVELAPARPARLQLPARRHLGRARDRAARAARPHPRGAPRGRRPLQRAARRRSTSRLPLPDDADHVRSWFVYVVKLPRRRRPRRRAWPASPPRESRAPRTCPSIHLQSYMRERYGFSEGLCPVSEDASARTMAIPFHTQLSREDQERVVDALRTALEAA